MTLSTLLVLLIPNFTVADYHHNLQSAATQSFAIPVSDANVLLGHSNATFTPHYFQEDPEYGGFPGDGKEYCGPVAVSNTLINLVGLGLYHYPIVNDSYKQIHHALITDIGSKKYIGTGPHGSGPMEICLGVSKFLSDNGYRNSRLSYYGWRFVPSIYKKSKVIEPEAIACQTYKKDTGIWVNFGWYSYNSNNNQFTRNGGHWVTLVNFISTSKPIIVVSDPAQREMKYDTIALERIPEGTLCGNFPGTRINATEYYYFLKGNTYGIMDGIVVFELNRKKKDD